MTPEGRVGGGIIDLVLHRTFRSLGAISVRIFKRTPVVVAQAGPVV